MHVQLHTYIYTYIRTNTGKYRGVRKDSVRSFDPLLRKKTSDTRKEFK